MILPHLQEIINIHNLVFVIQIYVLKITVQRENHQRKLFEEPRNTVDTREAQECWSG